MKVSPRHWAEPARSEAVGVLKEIDPKSIDRKIEVGYELNVALDWRSYLKKGLFPGKAGCKDQLQSYIWIGRSFS